MIGIQIVVGLGILTLAWMLSLVALKPRDVRLRSITAVVVCWTLGLPFVVYASRGVDFLGLQPMWSQVTNHVLIMTGAYCLVCFFSYSAFDRRQAGVRAKWHALVLVVVVSTLLVTAAFIPAALRTIAAQVTTGKGQEARGVFSISLFYTVANCYLLSAFLSSALATRRIVRHAEGGLRFALRITMAGLAALILAFTIFAVSSSLHFADTDLPDPVRVAGVMLLLPGFGLFLFGITVPAAVTRVAAGRIWWRHLRAYRTLTPLWTLLHAEFPEDALTRVPTSPRLDRLRFTGVHRRFYRRVIECRDGLVRISPYMAHVQAAEPQTDSAPTQLAQQLRQALQARASGVEVRGRPMSIASPATDGLDADVDELLALASALQPVGASAR
ncbi:MAB_1171c family putative transporter [Nocardia sp. NPDC051052]|uniref:MAB_1171c family putative transporter n=1 Tax=Nocardia sp. NPDC051052 TaxID=3364322 RepID=UPI00378F3BE4